MKYDDMLNLPYPRPSRRPRMSQADRAAQFSPFAALTGYEASIQETARLTDSRVDLTETRKEELNRQLLQLAEHLSEHPPLSVTYFQPDSRKAGGSYRIFAGNLKAIDLTEGYLLFTCGKKIPIEDLLEIL